MAYTLEYGKRIEAKTIPIPKEMLTETVPGATYQIEITTNGIPDPAQAIETITTEFQKKFPTVKIKWIGIKDNTIQIQIEGSPVAWSTIIAYLPLILSLIGVAALIIAIYLLVSAAPGYVWGLLFVGLVLLFVVPNILPIIKPKKR
jgi:hypothetical protein